MDRRELRLGTGEVYDHAEAVEDLQTLVGSCDGISTHEELMQQSPMYRSYIEHCKDVGSGVMPWWFVTRRRDWAWHASAPHDFWFEHRWLADGIGVTLAQVNDAWLRRARKLMPNTRRGRFEMGVGEYFITKHSHRFW